MLEIKSIKNGFVLDHIRPGVGVKIFKYLNLEQGENEVALIINAKSSKNGRRDIIKIENATEIDFTVLPSASLKKIFARSVAFFTKSSIFFINSKFSLSNIFSS